MGEFPFLSHIVILPLTQLMEGQAKYESKSMLKATLVFLKKMHLYQSNSVEKEESFQQMMVELLDIYT